MHEHSLAPGARVLAAIANPVPLPPAEKLAPTLEASAYFAGLHCTSTAAAGTVHLQHIEIEDRICDQARNKSEGGDQAFRNFVLLVAAPHECFFQENDRLMQRRQKLRAIIRREWVRSPRHRTGRPEIRHQISHCHCKPNRILREPASVRPYHDRSGLHASGSKRDVGSNDDVAAIDALSNPVIRCIGLRADDHQVDPRIARYRNAAVRNDINRNRMPLGNPVNFAFHGTGIGVDVNHPPAYCVRHGLRTAILLAF